MRNHRLAKQSEYRPRPKALRTLAGATLIAALCLGGSAHADDTVFDFVGPRLGQEGQYEIGIGAIMSGGLGTLAPVAGWFDERWEYRFALTVTNNNGAALSEWPLFLDIDARTAAGYDIFQLARANGSDIRVIHAGAPLARMSFGHWDLADNRGRIWFQLDDVPSGTSGLSLYFGNDGVSIVDDPLAVFSYSTPYASRYALEPGGVDMWVTSAVDGNQYAVGGASGVLATGELVQVAGGEWMSGEAIASTGPIEVGFSVDTGTEGAPVAFARTLHTVVVTRGTDNTFTLLSPHSDTTVNVTINGAIAPPVALTQGVVGTFMLQLSANDVVAFSASVPILVAHRAVNNNDGYILPPPADEVWGFRSGTARILAVDGDAEVTVYDSLDAVTTVNITQGQFGQLVSGGSGTGDAVRLVARDPGTGDPVNITVVATGDGDGGDSMVFHPTAELGRRWVIPTDGQFALIATVGPSITCVLTPADGSPPVAVMSAANVTPPSPGRVKFGADTGNNIPAGSVIECDGHGFAYYEDAATDDERNLYPMEAHRKGARQPVSIDFGASLMTRYPAGTVAFIDTPDAVSPTAVEAWTDFRVAVSQPAGSRVEFQISLDGGQTWLIPDGAGWSEPPSPDVGVTGIDIRNALGTLDTTTGRLRVRAILVSEDGISQPNVDAVRVFYQAGNPATHLGWDDIGRTAVDSGIGFPVAVSVLNPDGATITGYTGEATVTASHDGPVTPSRISFVNGRASLQVAVGGIADDVTLRAQTDDGLQGFSAPFDVVASAGYTLETVSGHDQFGFLGSELDQPLVVRVRAPDGTEAANVQVTFAINEGGGSLLPDTLQSYAILSDDQGLAGVRLQLGAEPGINSVRIEAADAMLELYLRADSPDAEIPVTEGCCNTGGQSPRPGALALALLVAALLRRRVRMSRRRFAR